MYKSENIKIIKNHILTDDYKYYLWSDDKNYNYWHEINNINGDKITIGTILGHYSYDWVVINRNRKPTNDEINIAVKLLNELIK